MYIKKFYTIAHDSSGLRATMEIDFWALSHKDSCAWLQVQVTKLEA